ncbi:MAG: hypothetical protein WAU88_11045 [Candidatus Zixiibacteriota bacterium]
MNQSLLGGGFRCVTLTSSAKSDRRNTIRNGKTAHQPGTLGDLAAD